MTTFAQQFRRALFICFITSIGACALIAIFVLLVGERGALAEQILATTAAVGGSSLTMLAAFLGWTRPGWRWTSAAGALAATSALSLSLLLIWTSFEFSRQAGNLAASSWFLAVAFGHVGLLSTARLRKGAEWCRILTALAAVTLAGFASICVVLLDHSNDLERMLGILAILSVTGTLAVFALHFMTGAPAASAAVTTAAQEIRLNCPRCGRSQTVPLGRSSCAGCRLKLRVEIDEEHCATCGYPLYQLESNVCPECGTPIAAAAG